jgi:NAD(P)-dependent dehydrogenase (short-subunit alcohol dehydrogenase family)
MADNPMDLEGRTILVTGASSGIGRETAILLSRLRARVVLAGRNRERLDETAARLEGDGHDVQPFDLGAVAEIPGWVRQIVAKSGPLAGAVHCAGIHNAHPLRVLTAEKLEEVLRINVTSAAMLAKGFRQKGCYAPGASMVFLSSAAGLVGESGVGAYSASKAALVGLTRSLAMELAGQQIRVNCIAPGIATLADSGTVRLARGAASARPRRGARCRQRNRLPAGRNRPLDYRHDAGHRWRLHGALKGER